MRAAGRANRTAVRNADRAAMRDVHIEIFRQICRRQPRHSHATVSSSRRTLNAEMIDFYNASGRSERRKIMADEGRLSIRASRRPRLAGLSCRHYPLTIGWLSGWTWHTGHWMTR